MARRKARLVKPPHLSDFLRFPRFPGPEDFQLHRPRWGFERFQVRRLQIEQKSKLFFFPFNFCHFPIFKSLLLNYFEYLECIIVFRIHSYRIRKRHVQFRINTE